MADIKLTADATDLNAAIHSAERSVDGLTTALGQAGRAADTADDKIARVGKKSRAAASDVDHMEAAMGRAARGAELFGLTAETAVSKLFEFGAAIVDTIRSIEDLEEEMDRATQIVFKDQLDAIKKTKEELDDFDAAWTRMKLNIAASDKTSAIIGTFTTTLRDLNSATEEFGLFGGIWATIFGNPDQVDDEIQRLLAVQQAAKEAAAAAREVSAVGGAPDAPDAPPRRRRGGRPPAADPFAGTVFGEEDFLPFWLDEANKPKYDEAIAATLRLGEAQHKFSMELEKSGELAEQQVLTAGLALPAIGDLAMSVGDMISESIINAGQGSKKAMREAAAVSKAFGIMDVGIKTSQAIMAALTIPPPAGPILAGLAGATGGIQAAVVASTPLPTFHVGGVQRFGGDDEGVVSKRVRAGEFDTTFTPEGFRAAGGAEGIARMNSGQMAGGGDTYLVMPDGIFGPVRGMAKPDPSFGQRRR